MSLSKLAAGVIAFLAMGIILVWGFSDRYGPISKNAYQLATATYGACMAKSPDRIERVDALLNDESFIAGMSKKEIGWFRDILADANRQNWDDAAKQAKLMIEEQVEY